MRKQFFAIIFILTLLTISCAALEPSPTSTPTYTPLPSNTPSPIVPSKTPVPPTSTPIPPTETFTPVPSPTFTSTPKSGDVVYFTNFQDLDQWYLFTNFAESTYQFEYRSNGLFIVVPESDDWLLAYNPIGMEFPDVRIEAQVELIGGTNYTYIELVCRSTEDGEYVFYLDTGGYWQIGKFDWNASPNFTYQQLGYGGTTVINVAKAANSMVAVCHGDNLSLFINDVLVGSATDDTFPIGEFGIGVETFDYPYAEVMFYELTVSIP